MGGEQYAVLMYGPKVDYSIKDWVKKFDLINKKEWVKNFINENHNYDEFDEEDEEAIDIIFLQEFEESSYFDIFRNFLSEYKLIYVFDNNVNWSYPLIGMEVKDYSKFLDEDKQKVKDFCLKFNLEEPTFYAGISGEFE